jgi:glycopeptide antibiotics resistance protein
VQHLSRVYISPLWLRSSRAIAMVATLVILALTLTPAGHGGTEPFSFCFACESRWLADGILNVLLFAPLGFFLAVGFGKWRTTVAFGFLLSGTIELLQTMIPGRDPSLSDVVFNTLGTTLGVAVAMTMSVWLRPTPRSSLRLTASSLIFVALVTIATSVLLSPAGRIHALVIHSDGPRLRVTSIGDGLGLDQPEFPLPLSVLDGSASGSDKASVVRVRSHWFVTDSDRSAAFGPTVGQGWALLGYPDSIARRWIAVLNAVWMLALVVPVGFWARGTLLAPTAVITAILLVLVPMTTGIAPTTLGEWAGAAAGLVLGRALGATWEKLLGS